MGRPIGGAAVLLAVVAALTGCAADPGPLVGGHSTEVSCTVADGRPTYVATQPIENRSSTAMTVRRATPAQSPNSTLRRTLSGPEMNGLLIVGGYDPQHGLNRLHAFASQRLEPKETMVVVFVSDVVDAAKDAAVDGVRVEYTVNGHDYSGVIPWTYRFTAKRCR